MLTFTNITTVKKLETALRTNEQRLQRLFDRMPILLVAFDDRQKAIAWNHECTRVTGYREDEMIGKQDAFRLLSESPSSGPDETGSLQPELGVEERPLTCKDGTRRYVAWHPTVDDLPLSGWKECWIGVDVTERREAVERLVGLFDSSSDALVFTTFDGTVLEANRSFTDLTGYGKDELRQQNYQILISPESGLRHADTIEQIVRSGQPHTVEQEYICKDGTRVNVHLTLFLVRRSDGEPIGLGGIIKSKER